MKTKFNCLLIASSIAVTLFSCKKKTEDVKPAEIETPEAAYQELIFRPKKVFVSNDSSIFRLVFENEYDELGRLKTENYYPDTNDTNYGLNSLYRREFTFSSKSTSVKLFVKTRNTHRYGQASWDSIFYDDAKNMLRQKSFSSYQSFFENGADTIGANTNLSYSYSRIGDTLVENKKGTLYGLVVNITKYLDQNNIAVKFIDSARCNSIENYKLEGAGSFATRYVTNSNIGENMAMFSNFERTFICNSDVSKTKSSLKWGFDSKSRPIRLALVESTDGVITKSYYRYEY